MFEPKVLTDIEEHVHEHVYTSQKGGLQIFLQGEDISSKVLHF